jgi:hypothetical protein
VREHGVSGRGKDRDSGQHKILAKGQWKFRGRILKSFTTETQSHREKERKKAVEDFLRASVSLW